MPHINIPRALFLAPFIVFAVSAIIYIVMMTPLDSEAFWTGIIWCVLGLVIFFICQAKYGRAADADLKDMIMERVEPSAAEKAKMDKEFKIWAVVVAVFVVIALLLYIVPFVMA